MPPAIELTDRFSLAFFNGTLPTFILDAHSGLRFPNLRKSEIQAKDFRAALSATPSVAEEMPTSPIQRGYALGNAPCSHRLVPVDLPEGH